MKTYQQKPTEVERRWWLVDAQGKVLGRVASQVARLLQGKHKPTYTPHVDGGDFVVVVNTEKVRLTGRKAERKVYYWHSGYPGGLKSATAGELLRTKPERLFRLAVQRMLPKTRLGRQMLKKLKVYRGPDHPHAAQQPTPLEVEG